MAFTRNTAQQEENRRQQELAEKATFLLYGLAVIVACFFVPLTTAIILVSLYGLSISVFTVFKKEIMNKSFKLFDNIASFFGYPPPPEILPQEPPSPQSEPDIDRSFIQRSLRRMSEPAIADRNREDLYQEARRREFKYVDNITQRLQPQYDEEFFNRRLREVSEEAKAQRERAAQEAKQEDVSQEVEHLFLFDADRIFQRSMYFYI